MSNTGFDYSWGDRYRIR